MARVGARYGSTRAYTDFYTLQVDSATKHPAAGILTHVIRKLWGMGTREEIASTADEEMIRDTQRLETGVVSVRILNRLVPINDG